MTVDLLCVADAVELAADPLDSSGVPRMPCAAVVLDGLVNARDAAVLATLAQSQVVVGVLRGQPPPDVIASLILSLGSTSPTTVDAPLEPIAARVGANPRAATALAQLLKITAAVPVLDGVVAESFAYSMLLGGPEFARWRSSRLRTANAVVVNEPVLVRRDEDELTITLNQPARHNAFSAAVRDALIEALLSPRTRRSAGSTSREHGVRSASEVTSTSSGRHRTWPRGTPCVSHGPLGSPSTRLRTAWKLTCTVPASALESRYPPSRAALPPHRTRASRCRTGDGTRSGSSRHSQRDETDRSVA